MSQTNRIIHRRQPCMSHANLGELTSVLAWFECDDARMSSSPLCTIRLCPSTAAHHTQGSRHHHYPTLRTKSSQFFTCNCAFCPPGTLATRSISVRTARVVINFECEYRAFGNGIFWKNSHFGDTHQSLPFSLSVYCWRRDGSESSVFECPRHACTFEQNGKNTHMRIVFFWLINSRLHEVHIQFWVRAKFLSAKACSYQHIGLPWTFKTNIRMNQGGNILLLSI